MHSMLTADPSRRPSAAKADVFARTFASKVARPSEIVDASFFCDVGADNVVLLHSDADLADAPDLAGASSSRWTSLKRRTTINFRHLF